MLSSTIQILSNKSFLVVIYRVQLTIENGVSSTQTVECAALCIRSVSVRDLKFVDDVFIMLLVSENCKSANLILPRKC